MFCRPFIDRLTVCLFVLLGLGLLAGPGAQAQTPTSVTSIVNSAQDTTLEVNHNGSLLAPGELVTDGTENDSIPATGAGTRMMWYPEKAAFRAGEVGAILDGTQWDASKIGEHSVAFGEDTEASGSNATAMGVQTTASNSYATAMGAGAEASGFSALATGESTIASGHRSTAMGLETKADGATSFTAGRKADANGNDGTFVWGDGSSNAVTADAANQVVFQAGGGMKVYSASDLSSGAELAAGSGSWSSLSSKDSKTAVETICGGRSEAPQGPGGRHLALQGRGRGRAAHGPDG